MLHIILLVLKIILWIILGLLGLALLLLAIVLLAPIHYKADVSYDGKAKVRAKIRYLIVSVTVTYDQLSGDMNNRLRILGIPVGRRRAKVPDPMTDTLPDDYETGTETAAETIAESADAQTEETVTPEASGEAGFADTLGQMAETISETADESALPTPEISYGDAPEATVDEDSTELLDSVYDIDHDERHEQQVTWIAGIVSKLIDKFEKIGEKILSFFEKLFETAEELADKAEDKYARFDRLITRFGIFWNLACTEKTKAYLPRYLKSVVHHIAPRKAKGHLHYGFEDAYTTGTVTGYLSLLPCMHGSKMYLEPEFHERVMDMDLHLRGHIVLGYIFRIVLNIQLWKTLLAARKLKGDA